MIYDSLYRKYRDRDKAIEKQKIMDIILCILTVIIIPAVTALVIYLILRRLNIFGLILVFAGTVAFSVSDLVKKHKNGYRYVHCNHNISGIIKNFEAENGKGVIAYGEARNESSVFKYTLSNEARVNCAVDFGQYTFTVFNDEWDEVTKFKAEREEDFEEVLPEALAFAAALEKKPDGEYDESLADDEEYGAPDEYAEEEDDEEKDEE